MWLTGSGFGAVCLCGLDANFSFQMLIDIPHGRVRFLCCAENTTSAWTGWRLPRQNLSFMSLCCGRQMFYVWGCSKKAQVEKRSFLHTEETKIQEIYEFLCLNGF